MPYAPCSLSRIGLLPSFPVNEMEISGIDKNPGALSHYEYWISPVDGIAEQNDSAGEAQVPEGDGNQATAMPLAVNPLNEKAHAKRCLPYKAYGQPKVISAQSFLPPPRRQSCSAFAAT
jgi:hypothetical protein